MTKDCAQVTPGKEETQTGTGAGPLAVPEHILKLLRKPLPKEAISKHPTKSYLSSIKAIYCVERLNEAFGLGGWKIRNELVEIHDFKRMVKGKLEDATMVVMKSFLTVPQYGIEVEAYGGNDNEDRGDAYKGACTDALTKIGSYLYIGMDVYKGLGANPPARAEAPADEPRFSEEGERAAQAMAQSKIIQLQNGARYEDISTRDERLDTDKQLQKSNEALKPLPKQHKVFSMKAWLEEAAAIKRLGMQHLGSAWESEYYRIIALFPDSNGDPSKHANSIRSAKPARECYKMMAAALDSLMKLKNVTPETKAPEPPPRDAFDEHMASYEQ